MMIIYRWLARLLDSLEATRPFTEEQAWKLYRFAALSEAFGWTVLITGIVINRYHLPGKDAAIPIAGQIHGIIFLAYFGVLAVTYSSLHWPRKWFLVAVVAGVPPYGTLLFEQWAAYRRRNKYAREHLYSIVLASVATL